MKNPRSIDALDLTQRLLRALIAANLALGVLVFGLLVASFVAKAWTMKALGFDVTSLESVVVQAGRTIMVIGILSVPLAHVILTRLRAIVDSVPAGPFIAVNASRLRTMGKALLGLELLHLIVVVAAKVISAEAPSLSVGSAFSATRWLAVLMLFVLARVFEQGTRMREDLEGTV